VDFISGNNMSIVDPTTGANLVVDDIRQRLITNFLEQNVRVYLIAAAVTLDVYTALDAANKSGLLGPGSTVIMPDGLFSQAKALDHRDLYNLLNGSVGV
jgi:hypothetical protein